jgi:hypothetical protein
MSVLLRTPATGLDIEATEDYLVVVSGNRETPDEREKAYME